MTEVNGVAGVYPSEWACDVVLHDGGTVHVRPIRPPDARLLQGLFSRLSQESISFRFLAGKSVLTDAEAAHYATLDYESRMALVVEVHGEVIAVGRYERALDAPEEAEAAFAVDETNQQRGIGTLLLEHLAAIGRHNGLERFVARVRGDNVKMLDVFRDAGFALSMAGDGDSCLVTIPLALTTAATEAIELRERDARAASVRRLLQPTSVAVVGAGREPGNVGHVVLRNLLAAEFRGPVYPVNPRATDVASVPAFPSVAAIPGDVDLVVVAVPATMAAAVVDDCAAKGVHGLVLVSAGYAETGPEGAAAERDLVARARRNGMRVVGPNCLGLACTDPQVHLDATFAPVGPRAGGAGFMSQSGALGIAMLSAAASLDFGVSSFVSAGNSADVGANDLLEYWDGDDATSVVLLYLESFQEPRRFARVARRVSRSKPIVAVKSGRTTAGSRAAVSHTAALASPDIAVDALFRQAGVIRVDTLGELLDIARVLSSQPPPRGRRVAIVSNAGGPGILAADACESKGLEVPELTAATQASLRADLLPGAAVRNPVDLLATASPEHFATALRLAFADDNVDAVIVGYTAVTNDNSREVEAAIEEAAAADVASGKPVVAAFFDTPAGRDARTSLHEAEGAGVRRVPILQYPESAAGALAHAAWYAEWRGHAPGIVPDLDGVDVVAARGLVSAALRAAPPPDVWLGPTEAFRLLSLYGIPVAATRFAGSAEEAVTAADRLGYPVALKAASPALHHKTDLGAVVLPLDTADAVSAAFERMAAHLGERMGGAVVQEMAPEGVETIVGSVHEPSFGPLVMFGMGGTAAELLADRSFRILPLTDVDAAELVRSCRMSPLLFGYRGSTPVDVAGLEDLLLRVGRLVDDIGQIAELDCNPVIVSPTGVLTVDAKVRLAPYEAHPELTVRRLH